MLEVYWLRYEMRLAASQAQRRDASVIFMREESGMLGSGLSRHFMWNHKNFEKR